MGGFLFGYCLQFVSIYGKKKYIPFSASASKQERTWNKYMYCGLSVLMISNAPTKDSKKGHMCHKYFSVTLCKHDDIKSIK